ncbi:MAG: WD40/YVTN/BNR-like repeat-containing protein [Pyrinomonadaceae bacterium]
MTTRRLRIAVCSLFISAVVAASAAGQTTWTAQHIDAKGDLNVVYFTSNDKGWIAGDAGYLAQTRDGGDTWTTFPLNMTENVNEIYFRNEDNGYLVAGRKMFITRNGGKTWEDIRPYHNGDFGTGQPEFNSIRFTDKKRGYIVGSVTKGDLIVDSLLLTSDDGGDTWHRVPLPVRNELLHLVFRGNSRGWIVGSGGLILATTDDGSTWTRQSSGVATTLYNVDFNDKDTGYAVGEKGTILRTENGGDTWLRVDSPVRTTLLRVDFADSKNGWIAGRNGVILRSGDKGLTWLGQQSGTTNNLYGLFMDKKYGWAVGEKGLILKYRK